MFKFLPCPFLHGKKETWIKESKKERKKDILINFDDS
jgi:hypothetical protein